MRLEDDDNDGYLDADAAKKTKRSPIAIVLSAAIVVAICAISIPSWNAKNFIPNSLAFFLALVFPLYYSWSKRQPEIFLGLFVLIAILGIIILCSM